MQETWQGKAYSTPRAPWRVVPWEKLYSILECVNNVLPTQLPAQFETRRFVDDLTTVSVANSEGDVTHSLLQRRTGAPRRVEKGET